MIFLFKKIEINCIVLSIPFDYLKNIVVETTNIVSLKDWKGHLHNIQIIFQFFFKFNKTLFYLLAYNDPLQL
jgi:hypothetical protein